VKVAAGRKLSRDGVASKRSITCAILDLFQETISLDLAPGKDYGFLWSANMTDVLISTIRVFGHCFWRKLGANYRIIQIESQDSIWLRTDGAYLVGRPVTRGGAGRSGVASPKILGGKMFDFRRITLFCLEKRLSKHKMTIFSKIFGGPRPLSPPLATPIAGGEASL